MLIRISLLVGTIFAFVLLGAIGYAFSQEAPSAPTTPLAPQANPTQEIIAKQLEEHSPLTRHDDVEAELREKWEEELTAAVESEYRRQRADLLTGLEWWLRDVWLQTLPANGHSLAFPQLGQASSSVAKRVSAPEAMENLRVLERLQWLLGSNIQEALALEVGLLKLKL